MLQHTESLIGMETKLNMETVLKKSKTECIEIRRLIIIPGAGCPASNLIPSPLGLLSGDEKGHKRKNEQKPGTWNSAPSPASASLVMTLGKWLSHPGHQSSRLQKVLEH